MGHARRDPPGHALHNRRCHHLLELYGDWPTKKCPDALIRLRQVLADQRPPKRRAAVVGDSLQEEKRSTGVVQQSPQPVAVRG